MKINIKATNIELTPRIRDYIEKKITGLEKFFGGESKDSTNVLFEIAQKSGQKSGEIFHADCLIESPGQKFYASADTEDVFQSIDEVRDILFNEIGKNKNKKWSVFYRGARKIKEMMRSAKNYRPWRK